MENHDPDLRPQDADETHESVDRALADELLTELRRRSEAYRNGTMTARLASDVMDDLRRR